MLKFNIMFSAALIFTSLNLNAISVDGIYFENMQAAQRAVKYGSEVVFANKTYSKGLVIKHNNVLIRGSGKTKFEKAQVKGKATLLIQGDNVTVLDIECSGVSLSSGNGACIRLEGKDLTVNGVYFHDSQQGILAGKGTGVLHIINSKFERLGFKGRAHAIYTHSDQLIIENSQFLSSKGEGHEIKSRARKTIIYNSVIASKDGNDSRLIDVSHGGILIIRHSILQQGKNSKNRQMIGFGLEGVFRKEVQNKVIMKDNIVLFERESNQFIAFANQVDSSVEIEIENNIFVGESIDLSQYEKLNKKRFSRIHAGLTSNTLILNSVKSFPVENSNPLALTTSLSNKYISPALVRPKLLLKHDEVKDVINVVNEIELKNALMSVAAGGTIIIAPGDYFMKGKRISIGNAGSKNKKITVKGSILGDVVIHFTGAEGFYIDQPYWQFKNLHIVGACFKAEQCEHAFHVVGNGHHLLLNNNVMQDFNAAIKVNGFRGLYPDNGKVIKNTIFNTSTRQTSRPVTPFDLVGSDNWLVSGNYVFDFHKTGGNKVSYGLFMKGNSRNGVIEKNVLQCNKYLTSDSIAVPLSFGGGGTPDKIKRYKEKYEHQYGVIRNNIVFDCPTDVAIYMNKATNSTINNNLLLAHSGIDIRFDESDVSVVNNILCGKIKERNGGKVSASTNYDNCDLASEILKQFTKGEILGQKIHKLKSTSVLTNDYCKANKIEFQSFIGVTSSINQCLTN